MAEHGTRTMYVHYGCRCDACCRAEHAQYLKRKDAMQRTRMKSKWSDDYGFAPSDTPKARIAKQRLHNSKRWREFRDRPHTHTTPITWREIADAFDMKCAICGCNVDPTDTWINKYGRLCFGRKYPTVDHIVSLRNGGADVLENVQLVCKHCNSVKGAK